MKAFKPDGSRWFAPTALEVMTAWLEQPQLLEWLACSVEYVHGGEIGRVLSEDEVLSDLWWVT